MLSWEVQEAEVFTRMMLMAEIPATLSHLYYLCNSIIVQGLFAWAVLGNFMLLMISRLFFRALGGINNPRVQFWCIFSLYQVVQAVIISCEVSGDQDSFVVNLISSTIVMMIGEVSPIHSVPVNAAIVAKHVAVWTYVGWIYMPKQGVRCVQLAWAFWDVLMAQMLKKRVLMGKQKAEEERTKEEKKLKSLLQSVPDGIVVISEKREVLSFNPAFIAQLNIFGSENVNSSILLTLATLVYDPEYAQQGGKLEKDLMGLMGKEVGAVCSFRPVVFEGKHLECRGCLAQWDDLKAVVLTVRDTSNWVALEKAAKQDSANKTALLRSVSHELRTPVNAIINLAQDLQSSPNITGQEKSDLEVVVSASNFLMSMINDLLDYSRILHDTFSLNLRQFDFESLMRTCGNLIEPHCRHKNMIFNIRYDKLIPKTIFSDENRLRFTIRGSVTLVANLCGSNHVKVSVEDTGIGIPKDKISKIFTMFGKLEGNQELNPQGCGLGLSISSMLVSKLGGVGISVESSVNQGSIFTFTIPTSTIVDEESIHEVLTSECSEGIPDEMARWYSILPSGATINIRRAEILIVDDSPFNRLVIRKMLDNFGFSYDEASSGLEAVTKVVSACIREVPFLCVIMDIEMPEMDGITATRELNRLVDSGEISDVPVIIGCSAFTSDEDRVVALLSGMNYYLEKPVQKDRLLQILASCRR